MTPALRAPWQIGDTEEADVGESVTYISGEGTGQGYLAVPDPGRSRAPSVIVIQEDWGCDAHSRSVADRFAASGMTALQPDLYRGLRPATDQAGRLLMGLAMSAAAAEIGAAVRYLAGRPGGGPVAVVGFRMGGSLALWSAAQVEEIDTAVAFYPELPWERMSSKWAGYRGFRAVVHAADAGLAGPGVGLAGEAVEAAGGEWIRYDYPGTRDGFFNDDRPAGYQRDAAALSWARTLEALRLAGRTG